MQTHRHLAQVLPFARRPLVFLTVVTEKRRPVLASQAVCDGLTEIWRRSGDIDGWFVGDDLLRPDHVPLFAKGAIDAKPMAAWIGSWKSLGSRRLKNLVGLEPPLWRPDYFDRFLRAEESYRQQWDYGAWNPGRKGLGARPEAWPGKGRLFEIEP